MQRLKELPDNSVDSVVTDPPYGLSFMGKKWDYDVPSEEVWRECLRVLKPGGHLLAFAGTRTQHRMAVRIEDAGFEIRDMIAWVYGSGFPKSLDVSKAIDKAAGAEREVVGPKITGDGHIQNRKNGTNEYGTFKIAQDGIDMLTAPATDAARQWSGWGTALKPALEPITVARKPLSGTVAQNVQAWGTGAINVDGCRIGDGNDRTNGGAPTKNPAGSPSIGGGWVNDRERATGGRWPANLIHDGSDEVVGLFPDVHGVVGARREGGDKSIFSGGGHQQTAKQKIVGGAKDTGSAARFFYCAKASKRDRNEGLPEGATSNHPTVKPTALMRYLCRLVTPPGGTVLDPFMGSGSTGKAAMLEGFQFIGIEREAEYLEIAEARIKHAESQCDMLTGQA